MTDQRSAVDELAVRSAIARLAILADQGDLDEYVDQFTEDATWNFAGGARVGRKDIRIGAEERRAGGVTGPGSNTRHVITTVAVAVEGGGRATADCYFLFYQNTTTTPTLLNMGWYHDVFVKEGDRWRLQRRDITMG
jgi:3-phenylpropionate/cinnamic acid dioxygenase small subunit